VRFPRWSTTAPPRFKDEVCALGLSGGRTKAGEALFFPTSWMHEVGKTPRLPKSWGPEVGPTSVFYSCIPTGMHGPTCIFWADLTPFSLETRNTDDSACSVSASLQWRYPFPTGFIKAFGRRLINAQARPARARQERLRGAGGSACGKRRLCGACVALHDGAAQETHFCYEHWAPFITGEVDGLRRMGNQLISSAGRQLAEPARSNFARWWQRGRRGQHPLGTPGSALALIRPADLAAAVAKKFGGMDKDKDGSVSHAEKVCAPPACSAGKADASTMMMTS
jgi:hypothetical protein